MGKRSLDIMQIYVSLWNIRNTIKTNGLSLLDTLGILQNSGYNGTIAIEYEGSSNDLQDCLRTHDLICKYWGSD